MPSTTDSEFASLVAQFGPGLSLQDMRMKQLGGPTTPGKSTTDLEYAYFASQGGSTSNSRSDNESKYWPGNNSLSDDKFTAGSVVTMTRTNLCTNPVPASVTGWGAVTGDWLLTYAANEISVDRQATAWAGGAASMSTIGGIGSKSYPAGVKYQRSVEIWVDAVGTVFSPFPEGFATTQSLPAGTWTRVVEQFTSNGLANQWYMGIGVLITGVGTGVHVKFRKAQLMENPSGLTQPYFDGSTPDEFTMDYAWTGAANNSTSTATQKVMPSGGYTNLCTNPTPGIDTTGWVSTNSSKWINTYANNEISVDRQAIADTGYISGNIGLGGITTVNLPAGVKYQRSVEVWTDVVGAGIQSGAAGSFTGGMPLVENTWNRVVQQFIGTGLGQNVMGINVYIIGYSGTGIHVKFRKAQLIENPSGLEQPYFDGTTPDTSSIDFAWTGAANNSTSTAKPL